jgi:hypothetical protein
MNKIALKEHVTLPDDTRVIELQVGQTGVRVVLDNLHSPGYDTVVVSLAWQQLDDVELLAARFDTETVRTFKQLITMLGTIHANKHIYEVLV